MFFVGKFILDLAEYASFQGVDHSALLKASGYQAEELSKEGFTVNYDSVEAVFRLIKTELNAPVLGLQMGEQINLRATAYIDQLMDSCSDVQEAFEHAIAFSKLISDSMDCSLQMDADSFGVNFALHPDWSTRDDYPIIQNLDLALICAKNSLHRLTQQAFFPKEVHFFYPKPKKVSEHYRLFNCHLLFNQPVSSIVFHKHILNQPTAKQDLGLLQLLKQEAETILDNLPDESALIVEVKKSILQNITPRSFQLEHVAADLNLSPRTLQRKLQSEGSSFKLVQAEIRQALVKKFLSTGVNNLDEIAYLVGFSESSALVRAFKSWTGISPVQWRARNRTGMSD